VTYYFRTDAPLVGEVVGLDVRRVTVRAPGEYVIHVCSGADADRLRELLAVVHANGAIAAKREIRDALGVVQP
jgi:hypothetical protein